MSLIELKCKKCNNKKNVEAMRTANMCLLCFEKKKKTPQQREDEKQRRILEERRRRKEQAEAEHALMKEHGLRCLKCGEMRMYEDFPIHPRTEKIMKKKPCFHCRKAYAIEQAMFNNTSYARARLQRLGVEWHPKCKKCGNQFAPQLLNVFGVCFGCLEEQKMIEPEGLPSPRMMPALGAKRCSSCGETKDGREFSKENICFACDRVSPVYWCEECEQSGYQRLEMLPPYQRVCIYCTLKRAKKEDIIRLKDLMRVDPAVAEKIVEFIRNNHESFLPSSAVVEKSEL